jgi:hypothetical protein
VSIVVKRKRNKKVLKLGKVTEKDIIKVSSSISREVFGIIPSKKHKNKKKYTRKKKHKSDLDL